LTVVRISCVGALCSEDPRLCVACPHLNDRARLIGLRWHVAIGLEWRDNGAPRPLSCAEAPCRITNVAAIRCAKQHAALHVLHAVRVCTTHHHQATHCLARSSCLSTQPLGHLSIFNASARWLSMAHLASAFTPHTHHPCMSVLHTHT
jgi:hypothetical protein